MPTGRWHYLKSEVEESLIDNIFKRSKTRRNMMESPFVDKEVKRYKHQRLMKLYGAVNLETWP